MFSFLSFFFRLCSSPRYSLRLFLSFPLRFHFYRFFDSFFLSFSLFPFRHGPGYLIFDGCLLMKTLFLFCSDP